MPRLRVPELSDDVLAGLFAQSLVGGFKGEPYLDGLRRLARLMESEIEGRLAEGDGRREYAVPASWAGRAPTSG